MFFQPRISTKIPSLLKFIFLAGILLLIAVPKADAQDDKPSKYEKIQKQRIKEVRRKQRRGDKAKSNKRILNLLRLKTRNKQGDRAYKGDITGRKVRTKVTPRRNAAYPTANPYANRKFKSEASKAKAFRGGVRYSQRGRERAWKGNLQGNSIRTKGFRSQRAKFGKRGANYVSATNRKERDGARFSGKKFSGVRSISASFKKNPGKGRVQPRSASRAFRVRKRAKPYAWRERSKWESAYKGDITGRKFRTKRTNDRPSIKKPPRIRYTSSGTKRDRAYRGKIKGGQFKSATRPSERAWKNDISGTKLRKRTTPRPNFSSVNFIPYPKGKRKGDRAYKGKLKGGGYKSVSTRKETAGKRISGKGPSGQDVRIAKFQGGLKSRKPLKGGGSVSRDRWNNKGRAVQGKGPSSQHVQIAKFQGGLKTKKPLKGGGSVSRDQWNNKGRAVQGKGPSSQHVQIAKFQGGLKTKKPLKGGGSVSRNQWNNKGRAIQGKGPSSQHVQIAKFQGNVKAKKPGAAKKQDRIAFQHTGNIRQFKYQTGPLDDMKYTGNMRRKKYIRNPNAVKEAVRIKRPKQQDRIAFQHTGNIRRWKYQTGPLDEMKYKGDIKRQGLTKNPNAADEALKVKAPGNGYLKGGNFSGRTKQPWKLKKNPSAADEALLARRRSQETAKGMAYRGRVKMPKYTKNDNSADDALKGIAPSRAMYKASAYQGNIKMRKNRIQNPHPSFRYTQPNNSVVQKTKFSLSLLWAKLFKKSDNQPNNLKKKGKKPRYDKREKELWIELYD